MCQLVCVLALLTLNVLSAAPLRVWSGYDDETGLDPVDLIEIDSPRGRETYSLGSSTGGFEALFVNSQWQVLLSYSFNADPTYGYVINYGRGNGGHYEIDQFPSVFRYTGQDYVPDGYDPSASLVDVQDREHGLHMRSLDDAGNWTAEYRLRCLYCSVTEVDETGELVVVRQDSFEFSIPVSGNLGSNPYYSPVPEPATYALMGAGLVTGAVLRSRQRRAPTRKP